MSRIQVDRIGIPGPPGAARTRLPEWEVDAVNTSNYASTEEDQEITDFTLPIGAGETWIVNYVLRAGCTGSGGIVFRLHNPDGATARVLGQSESDAAGATIFSSSNGGGAAMSPVMATVSGGIHRAALQATIINGETPGTVRLTFKRGTVGQTATVYNNSYMSARRVVTLREAEDALDALLVHDHDDRYYRSSVIDGMISTVNTKIDNALERIAILEGE